MDIIGRKVTTGYKEVPGDMISAGDRIALNFKLVDYIPINNEYAKRAQTLLIIGAYLAFFC